MRQMATDKMEWNKKRWKKILPPQCPINISFFHFPVMAFWNVPPLWLMALLKTNYLIAVWSIVGEERVSAINLIMKLSFALKSCRFFGPIPANPWEDQDGLRTHNKFKSGAWKAVLSHLPSSPISNGLPSFTSSPRIKDGRERVMDVLFICIGLKSVRSGREERYNLLWKTRAAAKFACYGSLDYFRDTPPEICMQNGASFKIHVPIWFFISFHKNARISQLHCC